MKSRKKSDKTDKLIITLQSIPIVSTAFIVVCVLKLNGIVNWSWGNIIIVSMIPFGIFMIGMTIMAILAIYVNISDQYSINN